MRATRIPRFAGVGRLLGFALMLPSLLGMLLVGGCWITTMASSGARSDLGPRARERALSGLKAIPDLPAPIVADFERHGRIVADEAIRALPAAQREAVSDVMSIYTTALATDAVANVAVGGIGFAILVVTCFFGVPSFLIGVLLVSRKRVWRCGRCGFVFDRA
jgi:hypothetical protein